jgi:hypothetical protein
MSPWFETAGVIFIALLGVFLGRIFSRFRKPYWISGFFLPCVVLAVLILARCSNKMNFIQPFCWITTGRVRFIVLSLAVSMGLTIPLSRLQRNIEKLLVCFLMAIFVMWFSVLPFLVPALVKNQLSNLRTKLDSDGVCHQSTYYTCGPAAAVTALGKLGLSAEEGEIAVLSYSSPFFGTLPACLSSALQHRYGYAGLKCKYRYFNSIEQLRNSGITLVMVKDAFLNDHCIAVLDVSDHVVTVADPVTGTESIPCEKFEKIWRFSGIVLERDSAQNI